jgi:hypothetical protein
MHKPMTHRAISCWLLIFSSSGQPENTIAHEQYPRCADRTDVGEGREWPILRNTFKVFTLSFEDFDGSQFERLAFLYLANFFNPYGAPHELERLRNDVLFAFH